MTVLAIALCIYGGVMAFLALELAWQRVKAPPRIKREREPWDITKDWRRP